jgi:hypothetical protein
MSEGLQGYVHLGGEMSWVDAACGDPVIVREEQIEAAA